MAMTYRPSEADRSSKPESLTTEPRYLGYRASDYSRPYASYFAQRTARIQDGPAYALLQGMAPTEWAVELRDLPRTLMRPGESALENGWTKSGARTFVAVHTAMPGCTAQMWKWWFGWHSSESARYKLWNPDAHQFSAFGQDRSADRTLADEARYVGNVSYVDEYIGGRMQRLVIRFVDPGDVGFEPRNGWAHICARVGFSRLPVNFGWLIHQVRPTPDGCEMRSRFVLNEPELFAPSRGTWRLPPIMTAGALPSSIGPDMVYHCAAEMNHLAQFLPALYEEFCDLP